MIKRPKSRMPRSESCLLHARRESLIPGISPHHLKNTLDVSGFPESSDFVLTSFLRVVLHYRRTGEGGKTKLFGAGDSGRNILVV